MKSLSYYMAIICCILSQIFIALKIDNGGILKFVWLLPFALYLISGKNYYLSKTLIPYYVFGLIFMFYCFCCESLTGVNYIGADIFNICLSVFILAISYAFGMNAKNMNKSLNIVAWVCFTASLAYGIVVYLKFLMGSDMFSIIYAYDDKNSAAQIFLSASIILYTLYKPSNIFKKIIVYSLIALLLFFMIILKSRATLIGFFFVIFYFTFVYRNKKVRYLFFICVSTIILYIVTHPGVFRVVVDGILFANRDANDLNALTSGRIGQMNKCVELFFTSPLIGTGNKYFDCFPIIILTQYGIIGGLIVFTFIGKRIMECYRLLNKSNMLELCAFLLMITYLLNSLFEAQSPFGPGVKCFPLWMIWGIMLANKSRYRINTYDSMHSEISIAE